MSEELDKNVKQWRFTADLLNDASFFIELVAIDLEGGRYFALLSCISALLRALTWVSGSTTKSVLSRHFAKRNNIADVAAKDQSQETVISLLATLLGTLLINWIPMDAYLTSWSTFLTLTGLHLYFNYELLFHR